MTAALQRIPLLARRALDQALRLASARPVIPVRVVVAVSGGADSVALLEVLRGAADQGRLTIEVAHLDHSLRGASSRDDAEFTAARAQSLGLPFHLGQADVAREARESGLSLEMAARAARYRFLAGVASSVGAPWVATAHHADDQAETLLLRLLRGTGTTGLSGMAVLSSLNGAPDICLWRPLLRVVRSEIEAYCAARGLAFRHDASNDDPRHLRNRVRQELLPLLETYNPGVRKVLARLAENAAGDAEVVDAAAGATLARLRVSGGGFDRASFQTLSHGLKRATLRCVCAETRGSLIDVRAAGIEEAIDAIDSDAWSASIDVAPNTRIELAGAHFQCVSAPDTRQ